MKKLTTLCAIIALCTGHALSAETNKDEGKKVPPGLQKKGGAAPGQAKKQGQADDATSTTTPAAASTAPAATAPATAPAPAPAIAKPTAAPAKPATTVEQKATLETHTKAINKATESNPATHKVALQHISKATGVTLEHLKEQDKNNPTASDTGLLLGNVVAKQANVKFVDVLRLRQNGKRWDEIAKAHNVDFNLLVQKASELAQAVR